MKKEKKIILLIMLTIVIISILEITALMHNIDGLCLRYSTNCIFSLITGLIIYLKLKK